MKNRGYGCPLKEKQKTMSLLLVIVTERNSGEILKMFEILNLKNADMIIGKGILKIVLIHL